MMKKKAFTMVEVIISLGILTIAMFTLVGLLPAGLQNSEETEHGTYAPIVADGFGNILFHLLNGDESGTNWDNYWDTADVNVQFDTAYHDTEDTISGSTSVATGTFAVTDLSNPGSGAFNGINANIQNDPFLSKYKLYGQNSGWPDLFGGYFKGTGADGVTEVEYGIRVWYGETEIDTTSGSVVAALEPEEGDEDIIFTVEVSWPPQMQYQRRIAMGHYYKTTKIINKK